MSRAGATTGYARASNPAFGVRLDGWTRSDVAAIIDQLMRNRLGVSLNEDTEDKTWQELGGA